jgi:hypothetical protein
MNTYEKPGGRGSPAAYTYTSRPCVYVPSPFTFPRPPFAGKRMVSPENQVNTLLSASYAGIRAAKSPAAREFSMTRNQTSKRNLSGVVGISLLAIGSAVLVTYSAALAWQFHAALNSAAVDSLGFLGSMGLASLHAFRFVALDHAVLLSVVHRILVLCSALIITLIGIALMPRRTSRATAPGTRGVSAPRKGDQ